MQAGTGGLMLPGLQGVRRDIQAALSCDGHSSTRPSTKYQEQSTEYCSRELLHGPSQAGFCRVLLQALLCGHSLTRVSALAHRSGEAGPRLSRKLVARQEVCPQS